ncbi:sensor domain-containing diguanylate cyclase [Bradyrhizobium jicamae]|uniref:diguanylate cyclase n=1 Tax=Bradyrhizobium jicamae TaxID=280332 RepID=A0ABS5FQ10_9BRAD|nr:sensor domain-containing diguanylate cyclase [Bradyrhizobium jicamae]MBR0798867.1 sensor domain-containing diguanylate cyclase [Bradyrhizobium jicamae]MBR0934759.1 sensor domain-containing diguanylate cyclase [Bradyrhizobium jicamae]
MHATHDPEARRLDVLAELDVLDTPRELAFDRLTALCRKIFRVPMSTLTLIDGHRQWFKASEGMEDRETARGPALCNYAIGQGDPLVVPDTQLDPRFADNAFVRGKPFIRFYAGAQLKISGATIGTLCAMDTQPREFDSEQIGMLTDLAAIAVDELKLRNLSMQDSLTGCSSRRAFRSEGERLSGLAARHASSLACAVLDVDHFKSVNDRYGHAVGDMVLAAVADAAHNSLRASDVFGRIGGEEFGILLPHTDLGQAMVVLEKVRAAVAATPIETPAGTIRVTCSLGGSELGPGHCFDDMLRNADLAMYGAKQAGRNRTLAWIDRAPALAPAARRVFKAGKISFNAGQSAIDCTVRGLSREGATIEVISTSDVPERFKLAVGADALSRACRITSRADNRIDVAFT